MKNAILPIVLDLFWLLTNLASVYVETVLDCICVCVDFEFTAGSMDGSSVSSPRVGVLSSSVTASDRICDAKQQNCRLRVCSHISVLELYI